MAAPSISDDEYMRVLAIYDSFVARGFPESTDKTATGGGKGTALAMTVEECQSTINSEWKEHQVQYRLKRARQIQQSSRRAEKVELPSFVADGAEDDDIDDIISRAVKGYERRRKAAIDRQWFTIKINEDRPYGLLFVGDAHLGDPGCNMPLLLRHMEIAKRDGIYSINMGDVNNRWVGRLVRKYMESETTRSQEERLAEWFLGESGAHWIVWLLGNHDMWDGGIGFFKRLCAGVVPMLEWKAQFNIEHPDGSRLAVDLSHGRKGKSIWNELHGTLRDAKLGAMADIFASAHTHNYACQQLEIAERRQLSWLLQMRGYKEMDEYARDNGFAEYHHGSSVLAVVNPSRPQGKQVVQCFEDIEAGSDYLDWLRA